MIQPCVKSESNNTLAWVVGTAKVPWRMRMTASKTHVLSKFCSWVVFRHNPRAAYSIADVGQNRALGDHLAWLHGC